jgi:membrane protease YdiL (CAAX protease family)
MDAPTLGVLHDLALLVWVALLFGVLAYKIVRELRPTACWNWSGRVEARPYIPADAMIVAALAIFLLTGLRSVSPADDSAATEVAQLTVSSTLVGIVVQLGMCVLLLMYLRLVRGLNPADLFGLRQMHPLKVVGVALMIMIPMLIVVNGSALGMQVWLKDFWPDMDGQEAVEAFRATHDPLAKGLLVVSAAIIAPLVEETIFRGFIYGVIKRYTDGFFAALCSSLLFAVVHLHIGTLMPLTLLALIFCAVYELTGSLLLPMVLHGLFNGTSLMVMLFFPDMK